MVKEIHVEGHAAFVKTVEENTGKQLFAMFCGSKDANGASWCPDCVTGKVYERVTMSCARNNPKAGPRLYDFTMSPRGFIQAWRHREHLLLGQTLRHNSDEKSRLHSPNLP